MDFTAVGVDVDIDLDLVVVASCGARFGRVWVSMQSRVSGSGDFRLLRGSAQVQLAIGVGGSRGEITPTNETLGLVHRIRA